MLPQKPLAWGKSRSCIRTLAEYGAVRKREIGVENVFDFSLGNPSIPAPVSLNQAIIDLAETENESLHKYTTAAGLVELREKIAEDSNRRYGLHTTADSVYVTCGAAAGLAICCKALLMPGEEVIVNAPFFPEYSVFTEAVGGKTVIVPPGRNMQLNLQGIKDAINPNTKAIIINSPNNPSGVIYDAESIKELSQILRDWEAETGSIIYAISDEPYRELVFDWDEVPSIMEYYDNAIQCYSYSKALSIPGERIGYILVSDRMVGAATIYFGIMGAGRCLGYVNPPSLFQKVIYRCMGDISDISKYKENRDVLCAGLKEIGYEFIEPQGAFYLMLKALEPNAKAFSEAAKKHELLLVPSDDFGCGGYVRIAYCVNKDMIERSMPAFRALFNEYRKEGKE